MHSSKQPNGTDMNPAIAEAFAVATMFITGTAVLFGLAFALEGKGKVQDWIADRIILGILYVWTGATAWVVIGGAWALLNK
jgi:hypothetical protein